MPTARSPSPPPPPPYRKHWDDVIKRFLSAAGLTQSLRGFESDMLVMSSEWEEQKVPVALATLREDLVVSNILSTGLWVLMLQSVWIFREPIRQLLPSRVNHWTSANYSMRISRKASNQGRPRRYVLVCFYHLAICSYIPRKSTANQIYISFPGPEQGQKRRFEPEGVFAVSCGEKTTFDRDRWYRPC